MNSPRPAPPSEPLASWPRRIVRAFGLDSLQAWAYLGVVALLFFLAIGTVLSGIRHTQSLTEAYYQAAVDQLETISELKKSEIVQWRKERLGDARNMQGNAELAQAAERLLLHQSDEAARQAVRKWLQLGYTAYGEYSHLSLLDASGVPVVTTVREAAPVSVALRHLLQAGKADPATRFIDFYRDEHDGQIYCAVAYAIFGRARGGAALGYVVLHILADAYIYPLIQKWPASSKTGETIIMRREGQVVRYLNNLRQVDNSGLGYTMPLDQLEVLAVKAALGQFGIVRGIDFMGVPVVGALTSLPDNSWSMVTKISLAEIESGMSEQVQTIRLLVTALAVSMLFGSLILWKLHSSSMTRSALESENRLNRSELQFRSLIDTMTQGLVKIDCFGTVTYSNTHFLSMLGKTAEEVVGQDISLYAADKGKRVWLCALDGGTKAEDSEFEVVWLNSEGNKVFSQVTPVFQPGSTGAGTERWLLILDTTRRKLLESQLLQSQKLEAIGQLAAGIAHEINTPAQYVGNNVQFIKGALEGVLAVCGKARELVRSAKDLPPTQADLEALGALMAEHDIEYLEAEVPGAIAQTLEGIERISTIVRSVKQFAHPPSAAMSSADLNEAMQSTVTVSRNEWKYVAELDTELDQDLPLVICMIGEINQVVLNLIVNAAHAIADAIADPSNADPERKGRITLSTRLAPPWAEIRVTDTGTGIPLSAQAKVFDPFFTTKEVGRGTGQGLAIARSIVVEKHHGQLFFETEPGVGTSFVVRLPLAQIEEPEQ